MKYDKKNMIENVSNKSKVGQIKNVKNGCKIFNQINGTSIGLPSDKDQKVSIWIRLKTEWKCNPTKVQYAKKPKKIHCRKS